MIFESVNYSFLLQDFLFAAGAGFAVAMVNMVLTVITPRTKPCVFAKDILVSFVFAVAVFSFVVSFANYPVVRFYHLFAALLGFLAFDGAFSTNLHNFLYKFLNSVKNKILCMVKKCITTVCVLVPRPRPKPQPPTDCGKTDPLKREEVLLYNL